MSDHLCILVVPKTPHALVARALALVPPPVADLVALVVSVDESNATAIRFYDPQGRVADVDLRPWAAALSQGGHASGLASVDASAGARDFALFRDGAEAARFTPDDETYVPHDEDGFPDLDVPPRTARDGVPPGWRRLRTCLDLGMQALVSCRFTPVARVFERLLAVEPARANAYALAVGGRALSPPQETPWQDLYRR